MPDDPQGTLLTLEGLDEAAFVAHTRCRSVPQVRSAGYLTVWTPQVQVIHHGTVMHEEAALQALREKWPGYLENDPAYNANHAHMGKTLAWVLQQLWSGRCWSVNRQVSH